MKGWYADSTPIRARHLVQALPHRLEVLIAEHVVDRQGEDHLAELVGDGRVDLLLDDAGKRGLAGEGARVVDGGGGR